MKNLKDIIRACLKEAELKYNMFSIKHPNPKLKGRSFKFLNDHQIEFLTDPTVVEVVKEDLEKDGEKLYFPADGV